MQPATNPTTTTTPEPSLTVLTAPAWELKTSSPRYRHRIRVRDRAHLYVSEPFACAVPDGEFLVEQHGHRYRMRLDGKLTRTLAYVKLLPHRNAERQRERWYYPVRILAIEPIDLGKEGAGVGARSSVAARVGSALEAEFAPVETPSPKADAGFEAEKAVRIGAIDDARLGEDNR